MIPQKIVYLAILILAILIAIMLHRLLRIALRGLLEDVVALPAGTEFYSRAFGIVVFFAALAAAVGAHPDVKEGARFMEYIWAIGAGLQEIFQSLFIVLLVFVALMVVLTAALRRKH
jgi:hypothetical protein